MHAAVFVNFAVVVTVVSVVVVIVFVEWLQEYKEMVNYLFIY